ncbi:MAG: PilZ domain-containing protein [Pseudomonadota bacterium]
MEKDAQKNHYDVLGRILELIHQMTEEERFVLLANIEKTMKNRDISLEEREYQRKTYTIAIDYVNLDRAITDYARDISPSGVFMVSKGAFQVGEEIFLRINFPDEQNPFKIPAKIVRTTSEGIGLKFQFKSQVQKEIITTLVNGLKKRSATTV